MKKILAVLLAVMMMALPVMSMAESHHVTMSMKHGSMTELLTNMGMDVSAFADAINDMIDAVAFDAYYQDTQAGAALLLSGNRAAAIDAAIAGDALKVTSNMIGNQVITVTGEEIMNMLTALVGEEQLAQIMAMFSAENMANMSNELMQAMSSLTMENTTDVIMGIVGRMEQIEAVELPGDPAAAGMAIKMTGADVAAFYAAIMKDVLMVPQVTDMINKSLAEQGVTVDAVLPEVEKTLNETFGTLGDLTVNVYMDEAGEVVYAEMPIVAEGMEMNIRYVRTTEENGVVTHTIVAAVNENGVVCALTLANENEGSLVVTTLDDEPDYAFVMTWNGDEHNANIVMSFMLDKAGDGVAVNLNIVNDATGYHEAADIMLVGEQFAALVSNPVLISLYEDWVVAEDMPAIDGEEVHPLSMTSEELSNWAQGLQGSLMMNVFGLFSFLPESVGSLMGMMMSAQ